ncbi:hypothetical protein [Streptomyces goshikiensis]|uniref:hypothetical protein n=1 Tax=Streptomyces goshikiensis TaxID=1942 RepID=UPI003F4CEDA1
MFAFALLGRAWKAMAAAGCYAERGSEGCGQVCCHEVEFVRILLWVCEYFEGVVEEFGS